MGGLETGLHVSVPLFEDAPQLFSVAHPLVQVLLSQRFIVDSWLLPTGGNIHPRVQWVHRTGSVFVNVVQDGYVFFENPWVRDSELFNELFQSFCAAAAKYRDKY